MYERILLNVTPPQAYSSPAMAHQAHQCMAATSTVMVALTGKTIGIILAAGGGLFESNNPPGRTGGYLGKRCVIRRLRAGGSDGLPVYGTEARGYLPELRG